MKRLAALMTTLLILLPAVAHASKRIEDRARETRALKENGRVDIIRAGSARYGGDVRNAVTMRSAVQVARPAERPLLILNVDGGNRSDPEYLLLGETLFRVNPPGPTYRSGRCRPGRGAARGLIASTPIRSPVASGATAGRR